MISNATGSHIMWSVIWLSKKKGKTRIVEKWCDNDLAEAIRIHGLAVRAGKKGATLKSCNVGFPPPDKYKPQTKRVKGKYVVGSDGRRRPKTIDIIPLEGLNKEGIFWCPYCIKLRRFQRQDGFIYEGVYVPDGPGKNRGYYCPMCGISHRDFHVRRWNPIAHRRYLTEGRGTRTRRKNVGNGSGSTRRRTRRNP